MTKRVVVLDCPASAAVSDPYLRLAAGVLLAAVKDAQSGDYAAASWLCSDDCALYCDVLDIDHRKIRLSAASLLNKSLIGPPSMPPGNWAGRLWGAMAGAARVFVGGAAL